jgi:hypothetical protein
MQKVQINGFEIYANGKVKNTRTGNFLNPGPSSNGYFYVNLNGRKERKRQAIHVLVATHFVSNPNNYSTVDHINGIRTDNRKENLQWLSLAENARKAQAMKIKGINLKTGQELIFNSQTEAANHLKMNQRNISKIVNNKQKSEEWEFIKI